MILSMSVTQSARQMPDSGLEKRSDSRDQVGCECVLFKKSSRGRNLRTDLRLPGSAIIGPLRCLQPKFKKARSQLNVHPS